jgi:hypothetical protein
MRRLIGSASEMKRTVSPRHMNDSIRIKEGNGKHEKMFKRKKTYNSFMPKKSANNTPMPHLCILPYTTT